MAKLESPRSFRQVTLDTGAFLRWNYPGIADLSKILLSYIAVKEVKEFQISEIKGSDTTLLKSLPGNQFELAIPPEWSGRSLVITATISEENHQWKGKVSEPSLPVVVTGEACIPAENKAPPWFTRMEDAAQKTLSASRYYQEWLSYTANLCSDVRRVYSDTAKVKAVAWRVAEDTKLLFHGDEEGRPPEEIFVTGLTAPEPLGSMEMRNGAHKGALESFSYSFHVAAEFAGYDPEEFPGLGRYVYVISVNGGLDVEESLHPGSTTEAEIAYPGGVHRNHIVGALTMDDELNITAYQPNPWFRLSDNVPPEGYVDVITVCSAPLSIRTYLNPANQPIVHPEMVRVKAGTPVQVSLADVQGKPFVSAWRINNVLSDFDSLNQTGASSCLVDTSQTRPDRTIMVEAVQDYDFLDYHNDVIDQRRIKPEGIVLVPRKGPSEFTVQASTTDDENYDYHFTWTPPTILTGVTGYRIYLIRKSRRHYERILILFAGGADTREASFHTKDFPSYGNEFIVTACIGDDMETGDSQLSTPPEPTSAS